MSPTDFAAPTVIVVMLGCSSSREDLEQQATPIPKDPVPEVVADAHLTEQYGGDAVPHHAMEHSHEGTPAGKRDPGMHGEAAGDRALLGAQPHPGEVVRDFALTDSNGSAFRLGELRATKESHGQIAVLTFWCATCSSCRRIERGFDEKAKEYEKQGALFLMVDSNYTDNEQRVNQFLEDKDLSFRVLMDPQSEIARYFGAKWTTTTAVIDAEGQLRYYGGFDGAEVAVRSLLAGENIAVPERPGSG